VRIQVRVLLVALVATVLVALSATAAAAAGLEVESFVATNCKFSFSECGSTKTEGPLGPTGPSYFFPKAKITETEAKQEGFTQAGGRVPYGVTDFELKTEGKYPNAKPQGGADVNRVRVDVATGLATSPAAVPMCSAEEFGDKEAIPDTGLYTAPTCEPETEIGEEKVTLYVEALKKFGFTDLPLEGTVYNLEQPEHLASYYGVALAFPKPITEGEGLGTTQYYVHSFVKGSVEWGKQAAGTDQGDYHDYFEVEVNPADPLISSRQVLFGTSGEGDFITNATNCPGDNTTFLSLKDTSGESTRTDFKTPLGLEGCNALKFEPTFAFESGSTVSDAPNPFTTEVSVPSEPEEPEQAQVKTASITLPAGMTLNPSAAHGLEACTVAQARIHSETFGVACPSGSELGTVSLDVPTLPNGSFTGHVYLGGPVSGSETGPITGPPYIIYVVANSERYGVSVRVKAEVIPNEATGQLTTVFNENPEQPFTNLTISFNRNVLTSLANPLACGTPEGSTEFVPFSSETAPKNAAFGGLSVTGCASSLPFSLSQSTENEATSGGGHTSYAINFTRKNGEQYLQKIKTTLPPGLVGAIPAVKLCEEAPANSGECGAASKIGSVTVEAGSGSAPYTFNGSVYMTGPYNGAPFGLSIVVPAVAGPFNLGNVVTRSTINVNQRTAQVTAESTLPTIYKGIPLRLRSINVNVNRQGFLFNPTSCSPLSTESVLTSTSGTVQSGLTSPFQLEGCSALAFKPKFTASTSAKTSKANGASLVTTMTQAPGQANIKSVLVQLPRQLPSRLSTLNKACVAKTFEENPYSCNKEAMVGTATAVTPTLPNVMKGPAILVSHAGEEFPSLELVLEADGVRVIVEGKTHISKGITTTNFAATPDVPVSSITVNLPLGPFSALDVERTENPHKTNVCTEKLVMPTTITGQNGVVVKQNTIITPSECGVQVIGHKIVGDTVYVTVRTYSAGRISGSGRGLSTTRRTLAEAHKSVTLKIPLSRASRGRRRPFKLKVRVGFVPKQKGGKTSSATLTVRV